MPQNMCLIDIGHPPPKWKTYNVPPRKAVRYSSLLKRTREFQQFIENVGNQVCSQNKMSSCCVIDKLYSSKDGKNIDVFIFEDEYRKTLLLKVFVPKMYIKKKCNNLLIYLNCKNNAVSKFKNGCLYVKCSESQMWKVFYNLFEFLLKKSNQNLIGTQFYVSLTCKYTMTKELNFLLLWNSTPKHVKIKKKYMDYFDTNSIPKTSLLNASIGTPRSAKNCLITIGSKQKPSLTEVGSKSTLGEDSKQRTSFNVLLKRKATDFANHHKHKALKIRHEFSEKVLCECRERGKWKVFKKIGKPQIVNYTDILDAQGMFDNSEPTQIFPRENDIIPYQSKYSSVQVYQNDSLSNSSENLNTKFGVIKEIELSVKSFHQILDTSDAMDLFTVEDVQKQSEFKCPSDLHMIQKNIKAIPIESAKDTVMVLSDSNQFTKPAECSQSKVIKENPADSPKIAIITNKCEILQPIGFWTTSESNSSKLDMLPIGLQSVSGNKCNKANKQPIGFRTACNTNMITIPPMGFQKAGNNVDILNKTAMGYQAASRISSNMINMPPMGLQTASGSDSYRLNKQSVGFLTAAGNSLNVSEKAILAAQKMFEEVCSQEIGILEDNTCDINLLNKPADKKPVYPNENYIDSDLSEKFFEEIPFDDKEVESKLNDKFIRVPSLNSNTVKSSFVGKMRKSLGGRRSLKPYTMKK